MKGAIRTMCFWLLTVIISTASPARAQWQQVGDTIVTSIGPEDIFTSIALDPTGVPYVATTTDDINGHRMLGIFKYDGISWKPVGNTGISNASDFHCLAIDPFGVPYIAADTQTTQGYGMVIKRFDGANWITVGNDNIIASRSAAENGLWFAFDLAGTPYIAFREVSLGLSVLKYNGSSWVSTGFVTTNGLIGGFGVDSAGYPLLAFVDYANGRKSVIKRYDNFGWLNYDTSGLNALKHEAIWMPAHGRGRADHVILYSINSRDPFIIMKHVGNQWVPLANGTFPYRTNICGIQPDSAGRPHVFIVDTSNTAALLKHDGAHWVATDTSGCPASISYFTAMTGDGNNHFYIGQVLDQGIRVMKYTAQETMIATAVSSAALSDHISLYPVPASNSVHIRNGKSALNGSAAIISDIAGRNIYRFTLSTTQEIDISRWPPGIYCLRLPDGSVRKMVKEN